MPFRRMLQGLQKDSVSLVESFCQYVAGVQYTAYCPVNRMVAEYIEENGERDKDFRIHDEHIAHRKEHALPLFPADSDHARVAVHGARGAGDARRGGLRDIQRCGGRGGDVRIHKFCACHGMPKIPEF